MASWDKTERMNVRDLQTASGHVPRDTHARRKCDSQRQPLHLPAAQPRVHVRRHPARRPHRLVVDRTPKQRLRALRQAAVVVRDGPLEVRVEPVGQLVDEVLRAAEVCGLPDAVVVWGAVRVAEGDVVADLVVMWEVSWWV